MPRERGALVICLLTNDTDPLGHGGGYRTWPNREEGRPKVIIQNLDPGSSCKAGPGRDGEQLDEGSRNGAKRDRRWILSKNRVPPKRNPDLEIEIVRWLG